MKKNYFIPRIKSAYKITAYITLTYLFAGFIWILLSDIAVHLIKLSAEARWIIDTFLDWIFVLFTSVLLFILIKRGFTFVHFERIKSERHEKLYKLISDYAEDVIWEFNSSAMKFAYVSPSVEKLLDYTPGEIYKKTIEDFLINKQKITVNEFLSEMIKDDGSAEEGKRVNRFEVDLIRKDGRTVCTETRIYLNKDKSNETNTLIGVTQNITDRKTYKKRLRYSEYLLKESQKIAGIGYYDLNLATGFWYGSSILKNIYGIDENYVTDINGWLNIIDKEYRDEMSDYLTNDVINNKNDFNHIYRIRRMNDGEARWIHGQGKLHFDQEGTPVRMIGVVQDITERKNIEQSLRDSEERYRSVVVSLHEGVVVQSADGSIITANKNAQKILGLDNNEILGRKSIDKRWYAIHEDGKPFPGETHPAMITLKTGKPQHNISMGVHKPDGAIAWISINSEPMYIENGRKPYAVVTSFSDITERRNAEIALKESELKYRELFENNLAGVFRTSLEGVIIDCNNAFAKLLGFDKKEDILSLSISQFCLSSGNRKRYNDLLFKQGELRNFEFPRLRVDGTNIWTLENVSFVKNNEGEPCCIEGTIMDITAWKSAEAQIIKERNQAQLYFEVAAVMFAHLDIKGNITLINKKGLEILEYGADEILGKNWFDLVIRKESRQEIRNIFKELITEETGRFEYYENQVICKSGLIKFMAFHNAPIRDNNSEIIGILFSGEDITKQRKVQEALRESRERLLKAQEVSHMGFLDWNLKTNEIYWSDEVCRMFGKKTGENIQTIESTIGLTHPDDLEFVQKNLENAINGEQKYNIDHRMLREDGQIIWVHAQGELLKDAEGNSSALLGTVVNITERKKIENLLRESEQRLSIALESTNVGLWEWDLKTDGWYASKTFSKMLGYDTEEENKKISEWLEQINPLDKKMVEDKLNALQTNLETDFNIEFRAKHKDGSYRWLNSIGRNIEPGKNGNPGKLIGLQIDITERKLAEEELKNYRKGLENLVNTRTKELDKANIQLQQEIRRQKEYDLMLQKALDKEKELNELKSRFISTTSHEFRTPLTSILSSVELIQMYGKKWDEEKLSGQFQRIKKSVEYLTKLLNDVLTLSRSESGKTEFKPEHFNLYQFCTELLSECCANLSSEYKMMFNYNLQGKMITADPRLLRFILLNILSNAVKYSPEGGIIEFSVSGSADNLEFKIKDNGIGILHEDSRYVFEPFHRGKNTQKIHGTGLGLSIVKHSVDLHGGHIYFAANPDKGTTFTVKIPMRR